MQKFHNKWGNRRFINLQIMTEKEAEDYCSKTELSKALKKELLKKVRQKHLEKDAYEWILSIKTKDNKVVGMIKVYEIGVKRAYLSISVPYDSWIQKYGIEAIDQFIKICTEHNCFDYIEFECRNSIIDEFIEKYSSIYSFSEKYTVKIA